MPEITRGLALFLEEAGIFHHEETSLILDGLKYVYRYGSKEDSDNAIVLLARLGTLDQAGLRRLLGPPTKSIEGVT